MTFKKGVDGAKIAGIRSEIAVGLFVADGVYKELGVELVVTEVTGGKHGRGSLHYVGLGADLRSRDLKKLNLLDKAVSLLKERLPEGFDVVIEATHIHLEFQPK